jgi:hypothetical protein
MKGFYFTEASEKLLQSFVTPYFLVPLIIAGSVALLDPLAATTYTGLGDFKTALASAMFSVGLVTAAAGARFLSSTWGAKWFQSCLMLPVARSAGFWQTVLAQAVLSSFVLVLTSIAILAALSPASPSGLIPTLAAGFTVILWATGIAAMAAVLTTPTGASVLATAIFAYSFSPLVDPAGRFFSPSLRVTSAALPSALEATPVWPSAASIVLLLGQSLLLLLVAWALFQVSLRKGIRTGRE